MKMFHLRCPGISQYDQVRLRSERYLEVHGKDDSISLRLNATVDSCNTGDRILLMRFSGAALE